jgi:hypothetical protein
LQHSSRWQQQPLRLQLLLQQLCQQLLGRSAAEAWLPRQRCHHLALALQEPSWQPTSLQETSWQRVSLQETSWRCSLRCMRLSAPAAG